jgi:hypothetical protein
MVVITKQFRIGSFPKDLGPFPGASTLLLENLPLSQGIWTLLREKYIAPLESCPSSRGTWVLLGELFLLLVQVFFEVLHLFPLELFLLLENFISFHKEFTLFPMAPCLGLTLSLIFLEEVVFQRQLILKFYLNG